MEEIHNLVGHFLKQQGYNATLEQFEKDYGRAIKPQVLPFTHEDLITVINDKVQFDQVNNNLNSFSLDRNDHIKHTPELMMIIDQQLINWSTPYPDKPKILFEISNILLSFIRNEYNNCLYVTTTKSELISYNLHDKHPKTYKLKSIIKKIIPINEFENLMISIDGKFITARFDDDVSYIATLQVHTRLVIGVKSIIINNVRYIVSIGWDNFVKINRINHGNGVEFCQEYKLNSTCSSFDITYYQDQIFIIIGKNDLTLLDVLTFDLEQVKLIFNYQISINDAEFSSIGFSPRHISIENNGDGSIPLIAIATSHEPEMRVIITSLNQYTQPRNECKIYRLQIIKNLNSESPQTNLSKPIISWRVSKSGKSQGVWVMGDGGCVRTIDLINHEVRILKYHQGPIKACITYEDQGEVLITCGSDKKIVIWQE